MIRYIRCPRCDLNYIDAEKQEYCDVCISELKGKKLLFDEIEDEVFEEIEGEQDICPICGTNFLRSGESKCEQCRRSNEYEIEDEIDPETDEEWKTYLDDDDDEDLGIDEDMLDEEEEEDDDFYAHDDEPDDFDESFSDDFDDDDFDDDDDDDDDDLF